MSDDASDDPKLGRLAHRLNNASMSILTSLELLAEELGTLAESEKVDRQRRLVTEAIGGVDRLTEIVRDLRGLSWGPAGEPAHAVGEVGNEEHERRRILVIDDERFLASGIGRVLDRDDVTVVTDGAEALALLQGGASFDVVLCDLVMNEVGGMEIHRWLADHRPALAEATIFMTAGAFTAEARDFLAQITNPILRKPFDARTLRWIVGQSTRKLDGR